MYKLEKYTNLRYMTARLNKKLWKNLWRFFFKCLQVLTGTINNYTGATL
jgi:hypothetical protein